MTIVAADTIFADDLNNESEANRATLSAAVLHSAKNLRSEIGVTVFDLDDGSVTALALGVIYFTVDDDSIITGLALVKRGTASGPVLTGTLEVEDDNTYFNQGTLSVTLTTAGVDPEGARLELTDTAGERHVLLRGIEYKLSLTSNSATTADFAQVSVMCESQRRRR